MPSFIHSLKFAAAVALATLTLSAVTAAQPAATEGTVRLHILKAGFIVGVGGGDGVLHYHGHSYRLSVGGIGIGSLGIAGVQLSGTATNLHRVADIAGTYGAAGAGATFVGGGQAVTLQNDKGVVLTLRGPQVGFQVSLGLAGMTLALR